MKKELSNTVVALAKVQSSRSLSVYQDLIYLVESLQQDIRLHNDTEPAMEEIYRNQGGIHWLGQLVREMKKIQTKRSLRFMTVAIPIYS